MKTTTFFLLNLLLVVPAATFAANPAAQPIDIPRTDSAVTIDGVLDESAWRAARKVTLDIETNPAENIPARVATEGFITYDERNLYVAFIAHDPEPELIRAHLSDRDNMFQDDFVGVVLDTFNDERRGFEFFVNPLGVQGDLFQDDVNQVEDASYNTIWESAGRITDGGYIVEMAIPFRSLRFEGSAQPQLWSIDFIRIYPRDERRLFSNSPRDRNLDCYLCQLPKFRGFAGIDAGNNLEITPTITASRTESRPGYGEPFNGADSNVEPGLDVSYGITPNVILNATLNPDFSQVEADVAQLDVNNQFALFFPERRPFFLEGQDLFGDIFDVVYTRNIADPDYGAKITGKEGPHAFGAFVTDDQITTLIFPGVQGNEIASFDFDSRNAVARYRYDLASNSTIGAFATRREGGGYGNSVVAVDGLYRFTESDSITAEFLSSTTEYSDAIVADFGQPAGSFDGSAWYLEYERDVREYFVYAIHHEIEEDFRADLGFVPQVGYEQSETGGGYRWFGEEDDWYRRLELYGNYDATFDSAGQELEREVEAYLSFNGGMQSYIEPGLIRRRQFYDGTTYYQTLQNLYVEMKPSGTLSWGIYLRHGDAIDFANSRPGTLRQIEPWVDLRLGRHFSINIDYRYQSLDVADGRLFTARITDLRSTWQFNTRMSVRWIAQYRDVTRDAALYVDAVDDRERGWANQLLFSYKVNPRTLIYAGYSDGHDSIDTNPLQRQSQTLFLKLSYAWQL
ncbi:MAG TPA: DUF5916 domain-containing protein [Gammaproteobacteria bacterium]